MKLFDIEHTNSALIIKLAESYLNHKDVTPVFLNLAFSDAIKYQSEMFAKIYYVNEPLIIDKVEHIKIHATNKKLLKELATIFNNANQSSNLYEIFDSHIDKSSLGDMKDFFNDIIFEEILLYNKQKKLNFIHPVIENSSLNIKFNTSAMDYLDVERNSEFICAFCDALKEQVSNINQSYYADAIFTYGIEKITSDNQDFLEFVAQLINKVSEQSNHIYDMSYAQKGEFYYMQDEFFEFLNTFMEQQILEDKLMVNEDSNKKKLKL
jgi:hypothetical protein